MKNSITKPFVYGSQMESKLTSEEDSQKEATGFMGTNLNPSSESQVPKADFNLAMSYQSLHTECWAHITGSLCHARNGA